MSSRISSVPVRSHIFAQTQARMRMRLRSRMRMYELTSLLLRAHAHSPALNACTHACAPQGTREGFSAVLLSSGVVSVMFVAFTFPREAGLQLAQAFSSVALAAHVHVHSHTHARVRALMPHAREHAHGRTLHMHTRAFVLGYMHSRRTLERAAALLGALFGVRVRFGSSSACTGGHVYTIARGNACWHPGAYPCACIGAPAHGPTCTCSRTGARTHARPCASAQCVHGLRPALVVVNVSLGANLVEVCARVAAHRG